ncbi:MAG TPA: tyrosine--tRNA ligase [Gammaproteobacteria bacterium]|nr:tyrosine--tRNA ligase [Gammaproteobacteria bacterium]
MQQTRENLIEEFSWRGLIAQVSNEERLVGHLGQPRSVYCGFDPTADSLHIGSLVPLLALKRFQLAGHRPVLLLGGATGLVGDPSGRDDERSLNQSETVGQWVESLRAQVSRFLDFDGPAGAIVCNNLDWTQELDVISFLRDIGKHFSVNAMVQRESVKARLEREGQGISYTEFSYMLLQAMDFLELARREDCLVQIGGSDQWGNIVSGIDLIRRHMGKEAYALTMPLVTKADGSKFGKTAAGAVWLDSSKTSPYSFYQFWFNSADADVEKFLKLFTFMSQQEIHDLVEQSAEAPEKRIAQRELARQVTSMVHGDDAVDSAERISDSLFGGDEANLQRVDFLQLQQDGIDSVLVEQGSGLLNAMVAAGAAKSTGEARKLVQGKGVRLNGQVVDDPKRTLNFGEAYFDSFYVLRKGKKQHFLLVQGD